MDPEMAMTWCILSTDPTFVGAMQNLLVFAGQKVFTATSWDEHERLQQEGAVFEGLVLDPVHRLVGPHSIADSRLRLCTRNLLDRPPAARTLSAE